MTRTLIALAVLLAASLAASAQTPIDYHAWADSTLNVRANADGSLTYCIMDAPLSVAVCAIGHGATLDQALAYAELTHSLRSRILQLQTDFSDAATSSLRDVRGAWIDFAAAAVAAEQEQRAACPENTDCWCNPCPSNYQSCGCATAHYDRDGVLDSCNSPAKDCSTYTTWPKASPLDPLRMKVRR